MDRQYMQEALTLARQGLGRTSPNPAVGAVLVKDGVVVGRGFHLWEAKDHAEMKTRFVFQDWKKINEQRAQWIERFNRDIKV